eukprot:TRINITY_DN14835_c0_g1_i1.p1 TRINITY_DN14835_c0_g1~~TRINITY_DN14835_c0_g1_i1.p1  ORF type:complete len:118 (+),score=18.61 TRINITY_DN14835_c0_g1_i1:107-460(+)
MGYGSFSRFARCRAANVSLWARQMNFALDGSRRGLAAAPMGLRLMCAETVPALSFAEQRIASMAGAALVAESSVCELASECDSLALLLSGLSSSHAVVLSELMGMTTRWANSFSDIL